MVSLETEIIRRLDVISDKLSETNRLLTSTYNQQLLSQSEVRSSGLQQVVTNLNDVSIDYLELSSRVSNMLEIKGILTIGQLIQKRSADLLSFRNFGPRSLEEIRQQLSRFDLYLRDDE